MAGDGGDATTDARVDARGEVGMDARPDATDAQDASDTPTPVDVGEDVQSVDVGDDATPDVGEDTPAIDAGEDVTDAEADAGSDATDSADVPAGECSSAAECDDSNVCTTDDCVSNQCVHVATSTDDGNACTTDACTAATGVTHTPVTVDDGDACTTDTCDPSTGEAHTPVSVDDGNACTTDACSPATGTSHTPIDPSDGDACTVDACDPSTGVSHTPAVIDDNNVCTTDACTMSGGISHTPIPVDDGNGCTADACDPVTGVSHTPIPVDDGNACTVDSCTTSGGVAHTPVNTDDGNGCTTDACNPTTGAISHTPVTIDDANVCTTDSCDPATGAISHIAANADDSIPCTDDACDPSTGAITHTPVDARCESDGFSCTVPTCSPTAGCSEAPSNSVCDDLTPCTVDACLGTGGATGTGCTHSGNDRACGTLQVCVSGGGCLAAMPSDQAGQVILSEFAALGSEFIELYNPGTTSIDVRGFEIANRAGATASIRATTDLDGTASTPVTIPAGGTLYGIVNPSTGGTIPAGVGFVYGAPGDTFAIADTGDTLAIYSASGVRLQDYVDFNGRFVTDPAAVLTSTQFAGSTTLSTQLDPTSLTAQANDSPLAWCTTFYAATTRTAVSNTAGAANGSCGAVVINEVFIDPSGADDGVAFIELAGPGGASLGGLRIRDIEGRGTAAGGLNTDGDNATGDVDGEYLIPAGSRMPVDRIFVIADATTGGATTVPNADVLARDIDMENSGGDAIQLVSGTRLLDALGTDASGTNLDVANDTALGLPIYETATAIYPAGNATLARATTSTDTNNNRNDFHTDPSPTPGVANDAVVVRITSVSPNNGLATATLAGVQITGSDFATGIGVSVGGTAATGCSLTSPSLATCTFPTHAVGRVDIVVTNTAAGGAGTATLTNGFTYTGVLNGSASAAETDYCNLQFPATFTVTTGTASPLIYGRLFEAGVTEAAGAPGGVVADVGFGPNASNPTTANTWRWTNATYNVQVANDDEYQGSFDAPTVSATVNFAYTYRFSLDGGINYTYCDLDGAGSNAGLAFSASQLGTMTVTP